MEPLETMAASVEAQRKPVPADNPFVRAERLGADMIEQWLDMMRDFKAAWQEMTFFSLWASPWARRFGRSHAPRRTLKNAAELRALPEVQSALLHISAGGFVEAVIRMLLLLAESRGNVRRDRLERSARVLTQDEPFRSLSMDERAKIIHEQTLITTFERERVIETLPDLLPERADRALAAKVVQYVPGKIEEMAPRTLEMLQRFHEILDLPPVERDVLTDPLAVPAKRRTRAVTAAE